MSEIVDKVYKYIKNNEGVDALDVAEALDLPLEQTISIIDKFIRDQKVGRMSGGEYEN